MFQKEVCPERGELEISYAKHFVHPEQTNKLHRHPCCELVIIDKGEVTLTALGKTVKVGERSIIFYPAGLIHNPFTSSLYLYERYRVRFHTEDILSSAPDDGLGDFLHSHSVKKLCDADFDSVISCAGLLRRASGGDTAAEISPLTLSLLRSLLFLAKSSQDRKSPEPESYIQKVTDYIRERCSGRLTASDIASHFFISRGKLNYDLKAYCNMTVGEYITLARVERAKELLLSGYSVSAAAEASGFSTPSYFIKVFSAYTGQTPLKFQIASLAK